MPRYPNMDTLPQDIWPVIASFLDDKTKRQMRLASTKWFSVIRYNNFNIYFTRKEDVPVIVERLSKYSWPIKLGFQKSKFNHASDIINYVPKLTNLVHLNVHNIDRNNLLDFANLTQDQWQQLSTLSNLQVCGFLADYLPKNLWHNFTKVTELILTESEAELAPILKQMSHLEALQFLNPSTTWPFALIPYPENLTRLWMSTSVPLVHGKEMCSRLTNLKEFAIENHVEDARYDIDLTYATALENCTIYSMHLPSLAKNSNLTRLQAITKNWTTSYAKDIAKLTKLQSLKVAVPNQVEQLEFSFLSNLTKLRTFYLWDKRADLDDIINRVYDHLPRNLKALKVDTDLDLARLVDLDLEEIFVGRRIINSQYLSNFSNLTSLSLFHGNHADVDLNSISGLTKLEDLTIGEYPGNNKFQCEFLHGLTNLKTLKMCCGFDHESFWSNLVQLTKIQRLKIKAVDNDDRLLQLISFKNLTSLEMFGGSEKFTGIHFTALTSLQVIRYRNIGNRLVHKKEDLTRIMPYLFNYSYDDA